jgi:hypothetical protein
MFLLINNATKLHITLFPHADTIQYIIKLSTRNNPSEQVSDQPQVTANGSNRNRYDLNGNVI